MFEIFTPIKKFLKINDVSTDNNIFRMHYKATVIMLVVFTLMISSKQFFGDPIHCMGTGTEDKDAMNSYCWIYGTYTLKSRMAGVDGQDHAYTGVGPHNFDKPDDEIKHAYYQWVCIVLLGQAAMFYAPRYLWKICEAGRLKALAHDLNGPTKNKASCVTRRQEIITYLCEGNYTHNVYALRYVFCEMLNFINAIAQIFILDVFLGGAFRDYGAAVTAFIHIPRIPKNFVDFEMVNPMDKYFPKLTKCWFRSYGPSGTLELKDRLCVLPLNIVNEKIFIVLWFWLITLAFLSGLNLVYRALVFALPQFRVGLTMSQIRRIKKNVVQKVVTRFGYGDWFILYLLGKNMNPHIFKELILELYKELEGKAEV